MSKKIVFSAPILERSFQLERSAVNETDRTVPLSFSSETPVLRTIPKDFPDKSIAGRTVNEVLSHEEGACDLSRLRALCVDHDLKRQIGKVIDPKIEGKRGVTTAKFSRGAEGEKEFQDVLDEIRSDVSVGYKLKAYRLEAGATRNDPPTLRVTRWLPTEVSITAVGADGSVGLGRSVDNDDPSECIAEHSAEFTRSETPKPTPSMTVEEQAAADKKLRDEARKGEMTRQNELRAVGETFARNTHVGDLVRKALEDGTSVEELKRSAFDLIAKGGAKVIELDARVGLNDREKKRYSLVRAARLQMEGKPLDGFELECSRAMEKIVGSTPKGFFIPAFDLMADEDSAVRGALIAGRDNFQRDLNVGVATQGGNTVQTDVLGGNMIELLRNKQTIRRLGALSLDGLVGNVSIPKQTGAATGYSVSEQGTLTKSTQVIGQLGLTPKRIGAYNEYSKQLLAQSSIDVENFVRMDLMLVLAILSDYLAINGSGANDQPTGILNTTGVSPVHFGAAATWAKALEFETDVANFNAELGALGYLTTPNVRGKWKQITKIAGSQYSDFLWERATGYPGARPGDGIVNDYLAVATLQVPNDRVIYGNFRDLVIAGWAGLDVVINPYARDTEGTVRITVSQFMDVGLRHPQSFAASDDSGAQ